MRTRIFVILAAVVTVVAVVLVPAAIMEIIVAPVPYALLWALVGWWLGRDGDRRWNALAIGSAALTAVAWVLWIVQNPYEPAYVGWGLRIAAGLAIFVLLAGLARWVAAQPSLLQSAPHEEEWAHERDRQ